MRKRILLMILVLFGTLYETYNCLQKYGTSFQNNYMYFFLLNLVLSVFIIAKIITLLYSNQKAVKEQKQPKPDKKKIKKHKRRKGVILQYYKKDSFAESAWNELNK